MIFHCAKILIKFKRKQNMNYKRAKIFLIVFMSIFMIVGGIAILIGLSSNLSGIGVFFLIWGLFFFFVPFYIMKSRLKQLSTFEEKTYIWYKETYPNNVHSNVVTCFVCQNNRIHVRPLMNRTFHREHFCTQCGKTLYYSPEQS